MTVRFRGARLYLEGFICRLMLPLFLLLGALIQEIEALGATHHAAASF